MISFTRRFHLTSLLYRQNRLIHINLAKQPNLYKKLSQLFEISESRARYLCLKHPVITKLDEQKLNNLLDTISTIGFKTNALLEEPGLFGILPVTLKYRYKVLEECGFNNITPAILSSYLTLIRQKTIKELKENGYILTHTNVENKLASYMTQWPTSLTTMIYEDISNFTLHDLRLKIMQRYLELVLDLSSNEFYRGIQTYPTIKHRPLEYINKTLNLLQSQIMMSNHKIKSNLYLIHADPDNLYNLIYKLRSIGGIDIKEVIRMHPKIAIRSDALLLETRKVLEEYGISNDAQIRCFDIYTLAPETVRERLENAKGIPEFNAFYKHPRFLKMIHYNKTAIQRLNKLYSTNKKCLSLNILSGSATHYENFEKAPGDRLGKGNDLVFCISQCLGKKFKMNDIRNRIKRHPFWINIPVVQVKYVYVQLCPKFNDDEIYENCMILLYPWKKVREMLKLIAKNQIKSQIPSLHAHFECSSLNKSQKLSLVLYLLEKDHYFSGNGVWYDDINKNLEYCEEILLKRDLPATIGLK